jgi:hypothetical protein
MSIGVCIIFISISPVRKKQQKVLNNLPKAIHRMVCRKIDYVGTTQNLKAVQMHCEWHSGEALHTAASEDLASRRLQELQATLEALEK